MFHGLRGELNVGIRSDDELLSDAYSTPKRDSRPGYLLQSGDGEREPWD